jgi:hypothetical protein
VGEAVPLGRGGGLKAHVPVRRAPSPPRGDSARSDRRKSGTTEAAAGSLGAKNCRKDVSNGHIESKMPLARGGRPRRDGQWRNAELLLSSRIGHESG